MRIFAAGRFRPVRPFQDFNDRTIRLFLLEILRRLDLPPVVLTPEHTATRADYIHALEPADFSDWRPLMGNRRQSAAAHLSFCRRAGLQIRCGVMNLVGLAFNSLRGAGTPVRPATSVVGTACMLVS